ncbi:MAG: valine--tRNA ligase [Candidatus Pacearchaeota archaeon]
MEKDRSQENTLPALDEVKKWSVDVEEKITSYWKNAELFRFEKDSVKPIFTIDTPPPYINAPIHIGHATVYAYQDFFARYKRMKGYNVLFPLGLDRNGLPIEVGAEKKYRVSPQDVSRDEFLKYCEKLLNETASESTDSFAKLGISFTSYEKGDHPGAVYWNDSSDYRRLTQKTFSRLYKKGLAYQSTRINNWDPKLQTTVADSEIEYKEKKTNFNHVKWKVKETGEDIVIGTTRPELICTCGMVIFHPGDERYNHLEGKTAISPIFGEEIPIKSHTMADPEKGTGIVMMCSAGDLSDIQFFREQGLTPRISIEKDGTMNSVSGPLEGLKVKEAREKIVEMLKEKGFLEKQEEVINKTPVAERSGAEIEFIEMTEWYVKQVEFKDNMKEISNQLNFYPKHAKKILEDWIDSISIDWPVSRQRYYATPVPVWHCNEDSNLVALAPEGSYVQPWKESPPEEAEVLDGNLEVIGKFSDFEDKTWQGDKRVFDTWFDSSISEFYITDYGKDNEFFRKSFPVSLRPQGKEIVRTWLYYTLLRANHELAEVPFNDVWIHQHILDGRGYKMSKSKGNVIDPQQILKDYGGEAFRLWAAVEGNLAEQDLKCSEDKIKAEQKTVTKLLNVSRFISMFDKPSEKPSELCNLDKLFIDYIEDLTQRVDKHYEEYDFHTPASELRRIIWETLASHYLELVKPRAYNKEGDFSEEESNSAKHTLHYILERVLALLYPIIPQSTDLVARSKGIDLHSVSYPEFSETSQDLSLLERIKEFNSHVWKSKQEQGISLKNPIEGIEIPEDIKQFEADLKAAHSLE